MSNTVVITADVDMGRPINSGVSRSQHLPPLSSPVTQMEQFSRWYRQGSPWSEMFHLPLYLSAAREVPECTVASATPASHSVPSSLSYAPACTCLLPTCLWLTQTSLFLGQAWCTLLVYVSPHSIHLFLVPGVHVWLSGHKVMVECTLNYRISYEDHPRKT